MCGFYIVTLEHKKFFNPFLELFFGSSGHAEVAYLFAILEEENGGYRHDAEICAEFRFFVDVVFAYHHAVGIFFGEFVNNG